MMKKIKKLLVALVLSISILGLAGCGKDKASKNNVDDSNKNTIVGKWQSKEFSSYVYTFNEDGTGDYSGAKFTYTVEGNNISITYDGSTAAFESTYEIKDNELNILDSFGNDTLYTRK